MGETTNYYETLGVSPSATEDEIVRAFRAKARVLHTDIAGETDDNRAAFTQLVKARDTLADPARRSRHDALLRSASTTPDYASVLEGDLSALFRLVTDIVQPRRPEPRSATVNAQAASSPQAPKAATQTPPPPFEFLTTASPSWKIRTRAYTLPETHWSELLRAAGVEPKLEVILRFGTSAPRELLYDHTTKEVGVRWTEDKDWTDGPLIRFYGRLPRNVVVNIARGARGLPAADVAPFIREQLDGLHDLSVGPAFGPS